jgi:DNA polymerase III subunit delta'
MYFEDWEKVKNYQPDVAQILTNSMKLGRISHAYIFEGPNGTKKVDTAKLFAKTLLCLDPQGHNPCGVCHNCKRVDTMTHPNLFFVQPTGKVIKKEQVQDLIKEFSKASLEVGPRIYIIDDADRFNATSANTLLKTMEEPGEDIFQILITENYNSLLKTITSRAETLHFKPIDKNIISDYLVNKGINPSIANVVSEYTSDIESAEEIASDPSMETIIDLVIEIYKNLLEKNKSSIILFKDNHDGVFKDIKITDFFLTLMTIYQKDILNYQLRHLSQICFIDEKNTIEKLSEQFSQKELEENIEKMLGLKTRLKYNINDKLAFDIVLASLERR